MSVVPCEQNAELKKRFREFAETLKTEAHTLGDHGLSEAEFYNSGVFRGAIERIRGQFAASMVEKRDFVAAALNHMVSRRFIASWDSAGENNRHDYVVNLNSGKTAVIELKGCLDGNNTNIFDRPAHANEFVLWSVCTNPGADPRHNVWSGLNTRLSAEIIDRSQQVDGLIVWDMVCGTVGRPCPKLHAEPDRAQRFGNYEVPPPCIYMLPATIPQPRNNPAPPVQSIGDVEFLDAISRCFGGREDEVNDVLIEVRNQGADVARRTSIRRGGIDRKSSEFIPIKRS